MSEERIEPNGRSCLFPATHWTVILAAQSRTLPEMSWLCEHYRSPLLVFLRGLGNHEDDIEDLVNGFFEHLLGRDFLQGAGPEKGRFRSFLIACLKNYLRDQHDRVRAEKRGGGQRPASLDAMNDFEQPVVIATAPGMPPDTAYDVAWADLIIENAVKRLGEECAAAGRKDLFDALEPVIYRDSDTGGYRGAGQKLGITEGAARIAAKRLKDRLRHLIRMEVRQTVEREEDVENEIRYLIELSGRR